MENKKEISKKKDLTISVDSLNDKKEELRKLRFDNALGQLTDTSKINKVKKEIARILTKLEEGNKDG